MQSTAVWPISCFVMNRRRSPTAQWPSLPSLRARPRRVLSTRLCRGLLRQTLADCVEAPEFSIRRMSRVLLVKSVHLPSYTSYISVWHKRNVTWDLKPFPSASTSQVSQPSKVTMEVEENTKGLQNFKLKAYFIPICEECLLSFGLECVLFLSHISHHPIQKEPSL